MLLVQILTWKSDTILLLSWIATFLCLKGADIFACTMILLESSLDWARAIKGYRPWGFSCFNKFSRGAAVSAQCLRPWIWNLKRQCPVWCLLLLQMWDLVQIDSRWCKDSLQNCFTCSLINGTYLRCYPMKAWVLLDIHEKGDSLLGQMSVLCWCSFIRKL